MAFGYLILEIDCWALIFDQWPLGEFPGKMIETLRTSDKTKNRDARYLTLGELSKKKGESYMEMVNIEPFVVIGKKWFSGLLGWHCAQ